MVPRSFCWIRLVKLSIILRLCTAQVWRGWDFAKTWTWWLLCALWIISSDFTEVTVKEGENEHRIFLLDEGLHWDFSPWTCRKTGKGSACLYSILVGQEEETPQVNFLFSLAESWNLDSSNKFWGSLLTLNASRKDFVKNEHPSRYTCGCLKYTIVLHPSL